MTMFANDFCQIKQQANQALITISAPQASRFAKTMAGDFNPLHDEDAKRFCVPGDLLFALVLQNDGLFQHMEFSFLELLPADVELLFTRQSAASYNIADANGKNYLAVDRAGNSTRDERKTESLVRSYIAFSGQNFPHILVPLMKDKGVMINPSRPLVVYESMSFQLDTLDFENPQLSLSNAELEIEGKRGNAFLYFDVHSSDKLIGTGRKKLVLGGLRPYDEQALDVLVNDYLSRQAAAAGN